METLDIKKLPPNELVAYYGAIFAAAAADGGIEPPELLTIYETLEIDHLSPELQAKVRDYALHPPDLDHQLQVLSTCSEELRFSVMLSIIEVIYSDDVVTDAERSFLRRARVSLGINDDQLKAMIRFVGEATRISKTGRDDASAAQALKEAAQNLGAVGVPIAAIYFSGSVVGLSAAGITSGLAALGLGLGMVPGIGVCILAGVAVYSALQWAFSGSKADKRGEAQVQAQRKAARVIRNLQDTINHLLKRIDELNAAAQKADANREAIDRLRDRITKLQAAINKKHETYGIA
jgi:uncharacterized tellurite resistance protein B-like protein